MTDSAKILPFSPRPALPHPNEDGPGPLHFDDGMCGLIFSPKAFEDAMASVVVSDSLVLEVPIWHWKEPTDRFCRIDAALRSTIWRLHRAAGFRMTVERFIAAAQDSGCRISYDGPEDYYFWAARTKADYDDPEACIWVDGQRLWESMEDDEFETHLGHDWSDRKGEQLRERLATALNFDTTFRLLESLMPPPFKTLDVYMAEQQEAGRPGDPDGRTFSRYLANCMTVVERPGYPAKSRTTFYRFLLAWGAARRTLGAHFRVLPWKDYSDDVERFIEWGTDISVMP